MCRAMTKAKLVKRSDLVLLFYLFKKPLLFQHKTFVALAKLTNYLRSSTGDHLETIRSFGSLSQILFFFVIRYHIYDLGTSSKSIKH
jgi:hypothetical protein